MNDELVNVTYSALCDVFNIPTRGLVAKMPQIFGAIYLRVSIVVSIARLCVTIYLIVKRSNNE